MLPIVILVWGIVFYQIFSYFFSAPTFVTEKTETILNVDEIKQDTFSIIANYRDPFLGENSSINLPKITTSSKSTSTKTQKPAEPKPLEKPWPIITYKGMIKNNNSEKKVCIISIDNKEQLVKEGDDINGVKITMIKKESVQVSFQKEQKTITK